MRVLVSTHDLERAGSLRSAFRDEDFTVELVTDQEDIARGDAALLVLTGASRELPVQAASMGLPVLSLDGDADPEEMGGHVEVLAPDTPAEEVALQGRRLVQRRRLQEATGIVGETDAIREALERVVQIAPVEATVLVTGESGTGKELVARGIHALSPRRHAPFIPVNVAALPDTLLESELFGHEKGAFTGAIDSRRGLFELAHGGTIFLDEIGEMPLATQSKLLRVLEQREFLRVGGEKPINVDTRIITATNQHLRLLVATGDFRKDLYYRLNVLSIELPPLRERVDDIPILVDAFIRDASERHDRPFHGISSDAMEILKSYHWPGNVRELRNLVESMVVLGPGRSIGANDIPPEVRSVKKGASLVPVSRPPTRSEEGELRPQLEFVFRTLVDLRVDVDQLKQEFEAYRETVGAPGWLGSLPPPASEPPEDQEPELVEWVESAGSPDADADETEAREEEADEEEGVVVYRPGMTMDDVERQVIFAALDEVDGNRRLAAKRLGVGERTLYRKLKQYSDEDGS